MNFYNDNYEITLKRLVNHCDDMEQYLNANLTLTDSGTAGIDSFRFAYEKGLVEALEREGFEVDLSSYGYGDPYLIEISLIPSLNLMVAYELKFYRRNLSEYMEPEDYQAAYDEFKKSDLSEDLTIEEWLTDNVKRIYKLNLNFPNDVLYTKWKELPHGKGYYSVSFV